MEKIVTRPIAKEIVLRGKPEDGHVDVFSYNYEGSGSSVLGGLFIVGQVQPATEDTSYMINLVASLAKREYYAKIGDEPKEAFSKTLKKINEVLQDFFRNKDLKVNIGIFAISGENIFISRLGKFKILLVRDNQDIDILNNINLFSKEHIQEKEFSNIISGKLISQDKLFAFYPGRSMIAREKNIKTYLAKMDADEVSEKLRLIKQDNDNFLCAALHISINKYKEPAVIISPQPQELRQPTESDLQTPETSPRTVLAKISKIKPQAKVEPSLAAQPEIKTEPIRPTSLDISPALPAGRSSPSPQQFNEVPPPLIRATEFSSAKKQNFLDLIMKKFKPSGAYIIGIGTGRVIPKKPFIITGSLIAGLAVFAVVAKLTFAPSLPIPGIESSQDKAVTAVFDNIKAKLESAKNFKDQNNLLEARRLMFESLSALTSSNIADSEKIANLEQEVYSAIDQIDKAVEISPNLFQQIPQDLGESSLIGLIKDKLFVYLNNSSGDGGSLVEVKQDGINKVSTVKDFDPGYLTGGDELIIMFNKVVDQVASLTIKNGDMKTSALSLSGQAISLYPYQDNLYITTSDGIYKITDAASGKSNPVSWLSKDAKMPANPLLMAVDGNVFVITKDGILAKFYKGDKVSEVNTAIPIDGSDILLTTSDALDLYLVDKNLGRIYVINKDSGSVVKTLKLGNSSIVSGTIANDRTIYLLSKDNKVWKVVP